MNRSFVLRNARACDITACLNALAKAAQKRSGPNRPQVPDLHVVLTEESMLHVFVNLAPNQAVWSIYSDLPNCVQRLGSRLLGVTTVLRPGCAARSGSPCVGKCKEDLEIHISQQPGFPLTVEEVNWFILTYFGMHELARCFAPKDQLYLKDVTDGIWAAQHDQACPEENVRRTGAPQLAANVWLFGRIDRLTDPYDNRHLREPWKDIYRAEKGRLPINADKRFRQIAHLYADKIVQRRKPIP